MGRVLSSLFRRQYTAWWTAPRPRVTPGGVSASITILACYPASHPCRHQMGCPRRQAAQPTSVSPTSPAVSPTTQEYAHTLDAKSGSVLARTRADASFTFGAFEPQPDSRFWHRNLSRVARKRFSQPPMNVACRTSGLSSQKMIVTSSSSPDDSVPK